MLIIVVFVMMGGIVLALVLFKNNKEKQLAAKFDFDGEATAIAGPGSG